MNYKILITKKIKKKKKTGAFPVKVLDSFRVLRAKSYIFSFNNSNPDGIPNGIIQKAK